MRLNLSLFMAFMALTNVALGGVGEAGVSDGFNNPPLTGSFTAGVAYSGGAAPQPSGSLPTGLEENQEAGGGALPPSTYPGQQISGFGQPLAGYSSGQGNPLSAGGSPAPQLQTSQGGQGSGYPSGAPQLSGPYQERFSADDLKLVQPNAEVFQPDGSLNFVSATPPSGMIGVESSAGAIPGEGSWYYPGSVSSRNKFYVQTSSGFATVGGCSYGGHVPLWVDIASSDNFYVYEWYPGKWSPYVRWWGWTWPGFKKGWFSGDVPGWHILCYHARDWSNYVYIYVWPGSGGAVSGNAPGGPAQISTSGTLPSGAPTPPDPNAESLMLPDFNLISKSQSCSGQGCTSGWSGYPSQSCSGQGTCVDQSYKTAYPKASTCKWNEYYIQGWLGHLATVGSVKCGDWLPLWSKINIAGSYWSFEWTQGCGYPSGFCYPEVKDFGYKGTGWYSTWFRGNKPGWHVLSYYSNDWSNYIYIYVWPSS